MTKRTVKSIAAAAVAVILIAVFVQPACSCSSKDPAYYSSMRAELLNVFDAQAQLFTDSARYATSMDELQARGLLVAPEVTITLTPTSATAWEASATHSKLFDVRCAIANANGQDKLASVACDPPYKKRGWRFSLGF